MRRSPPEPAGGPALAELSRALLEHPTEPFDFLWLRTMVQGRASPLGDVPLFDMFTLHGSCDNHMGGGRVRLSCDVRWQRAGEPRDDRWFGAPHQGMVAWDTAASTAPGHWARPTPHAENLQPACLKAITAWLRSVRNNDKPFSSSFKPTFAPTSA